MSKAVNVRDNATAKVECEVLEAIPEQIPDPIKDLLNDICSEETGEPGGGGLPVAPPAPAEGPAIPEEPQLRINCSEGIRKVKRQLRRIEKLGLPDDVKQELLDPLRERIKELGKECDKLADQVQEETDDLLDEVLDNAPDVGDVPDVDDTIDGLTGDASGTTTTPAASGCRRERRRGLVQQLPWVPRTMSMLTKFSLLVAIALTSTSCAALGIGGGCDGTPLIAEFEQVGDLVENSNVQSPRRRDR